VSFLLLHGWQNRRPPGHWHHWLAGELAAAGHHVVYPQLPEPDQPVLADWVAALRTHLGALPEGALPGGALSNGDLPSGDLPSGDLPDGDWTVVCHSLGCLLWLHAAATGQVPLPVGRVLLVAPPGPDVVAGIPEIAVFHPPDVTGEQLGAAARHTRLVCSDNDPYCPSGAEADYGVPLGIPTTVLNGYGAWPSLRDWCLSGSPDAPLTSRPA
jgi:predicted alpha/beta hydrolase family esterase